MIYSQSVEIFAVKIEIQYDPFHTQLASVDTCADIVQASSDVP